MSDKITFYVSSVTGNTNLKKQQIKIQMVLDSKKIEYEEVDIASEEGAKEKMRSLAGEGTLAPQLAKGDLYLGDYNAFEEAVENETLETFFKLN